VVDARLMVEMTAGDEDADGAGCRRERERREGGDEELKWGGGFRVSGNRERREKIEGINGWGK